MIYKTYRTAPNMKPGIYFTNRYLESNSQSAKQLNPSQTIGKLRYGIKFFILFVCKTYFFYPFSFVVPTPIIEEIDHTKNQSCSRGH
jgi:hypothetical protein